MAVHSGAEATGPASLRHEYLDALLAYDATRARHLIERARVDGLGVPAIYLDVLQPALEDLGDLWAAGRIGVAAEHLASSVTHGIVGALGPLMRRPPTGGRLAVLACTPGEQHALGCRMAADFLEAAGWEVLALGASLPADSLAALVAAERPDVVGLSTATAAQLPGAAEAVRRLRGLDTPPYIVVGGRAWLGVPDARRAATGADAAMVDPRTLVRLLAERFPALPDEGT